MDVDFESLFNALKEKGVFVQPDTLQKYQQQGFMSRVFTIVSSKGKLVIHITNLVEEHQRNRVWEKFLGLAKLFTDHPEIPTAPFYYSGLIDNNFFLVQSFLDGRQAGNRILKDNIFADEWGVDKFSTVEKSLKEIAKIHAIRIENFGWPVLAGEKLKGSYPTWAAFLQDKIPQWIQGVEESDKKLSQNFTPVRELEKFMQRCAGKAVDYANSPRLIHGDTINPGNILVRDNGDVYILDWEWSIAGDPAWEFCDLGWWPMLNKKELSLYFGACNITGDSEKDNFLERVRSYIPLWVLWGSYVHVNDDRNFGAYVALRKLLDDTAKTI